MSNPMPSAQSVLRNDFHQLIAGELQDSDTRFEVINPATAAPFALCPAATRAQLDAAVQAAALAQPAWRACGYEQRRALLRRMTDILRANQDLLAELLTREQGKPLGQSRDEIGRAATQSDGMAQLQIGRETIVDDAQRHIELEYVPLGVIGIIIPWNAPVNLAAGPLTAALYTGNTAVLKPSPFAPLTMLKIGELIRDVFPAGVVNILAGSDEFGQWMSEHPRIAKISFTGSVATGKKVMASAAGTLKRVTLELGGNDAAIVLDDADVAAIASKLFFAATVNSGQVCMAVKRIYAHERIYESLCAALAAEARKARIGDGLLPDTQIGPIQNRRQYERVLGILDDTRRRGARFLAGGEALPGPGYFIAPTIVTDIADDSRLVQEEQFGPVVPVLKFHDIDEVIRRANDTRYGLAGSVWSRDPERARAVAERLDVGTVWINQHRATAANVPFGGAKESGIGRHYSVLGLKSDMEPRVISILK
jgi:acyl-CoA reductase-like NAD-dependent aldehyde dehydrogenase